MNEKFISKGHLAYRWISIILIIAALIYAVARIVMLIRMKEYEYNLLTFSFVITIFYCFSLCYHLIHRVDLFRFQMPINNYIAIIIFNIILFHWSSVGIYLYSKRAIIAFRIVLLIVLVTNTISFVFICMYDVKEISDPVTDLVIRNRSFLILAAMSGVDSLIFAGFCMWFLYHIHKLRNHPNSYTRFTQLCLFTGLASATFIIYLVTTINWTQHGTDNNNETTATADTAFDVSGIVRAFIFIAALGVNWPSNTKRHSSVHEPLSGLTTIGNNNPTDSVVVNVPNQEKPNMRAPARVIVPIIEEV
ncbi:hypothetical protein BDF22DRAFT_364442 [Syncephalis plumigaleata]|nr:hypothetical protein BDF22DRAFT_364442 [Syncephalis plumigaleata]